MAKSKKAIIIALKAADTATIAFGGLVDPEAVEEARQDIIDQWKRRVDAYAESHPDAKVVLVIGDNLVSAGGKFKFLPAFPKTGKVVTRSKDYIIDDVYCDYADILPLTFAETAETWAFETKAGNTVIIPK